MTRGDVAAKAAFVRQALAALAEIPQGTYAEFLSDGRNLPSALHWLQAAIQALIDIALVLVSERGLPIPRSSAEVLERLESVGLPAGTASKYRPAIGFRNRVVHLYERIDPAIVYRVLTEDRRELAGLLVLLLELGRAHPPS